MRALNSRMKASSSSVSIALTALLLFLSAVHRKHGEPDDWLSAVDHIQCPDSNVEVLWEIKKIPV